MVIERESKENAEDSEHPEPQSVESSNPPKNGENLDGIFTPRFKSVAARAGWDEEALLMASLVVDDTPDRQFRSRKRSDSQLKSPPTSSRSRNKRAKRTPISVPVAVLNLEEEEMTVKGNEKKDKGKGKETVNEPKKKDDLVEEKSAGSLPCIDKLREELSCAVCLDICFEPSTTPCGHSFCKKCLSSAAEKCGKKCPKCRHLISNGRSCTVNTVLWNTIQLLFPQEIEARKKVAKASGGSSQEPKKQSQNRHFSLNQSTRTPSAYSTRARTTIIETNSVTTDSSDSDSSSEELVRTTAINPTSWRRSGRTVRNDSAESASSRIIRMLRSSNGRNRSVMSQDGDAALALRLQREEYMGAIRGTTATTRVRSSSNSSTNSNSSSVSNARANLRALASRAVYLRNVRPRPRV